MHPGWRGATTALIWICALLSSTSAIAQVAPLNSDDVVPDELEGWLSWAMRHDPDGRCAQLQPSDWRCSWPGELRLDLTDDGGRFTLYVAADAPLRTNIVGDRQHWPMDVDVDGRKAVVGGTDQPTVFLEPGQHVVTGRLAWEAPPPFVTVPTEVARVEVRDPRGEARQVRLDAGRLWLSRSGDAEATDEADTLQVAVYRLIADGIPLRATTRLELRATGRGRQVNLGRVLLPGTRPTKIRSELPVTIAQGGEVGMFVRPGTHIVELDAIAARPATELAVPGLSNDRFDEQEVWVWVDEPLFRDVRLSGLSGVSAGQVNVPEGWLAGTVFVAEREQVLGIDEVRRGEVRSRPNGLSVDRHLWLDLDGTGWTARDRVSGEMRRDWRLDHGPKGTVRRVTDLGQTRDLLITRHPETQREGVELRATDVNLQAEVRLDGAEHKLDIVGWDHDVQSLSATVHLPPGWELVGASGADRVPNTWSDSWTLFDVLLLLLIGVGVGFLRGWPWGLVAVVALALGQGHPDAPRWVWVHLVVSLALLRYLPEGWWRHLVVVYRTGALVALLAIVAPHSVDLVMTAFHPQVANRTTASLLEMEKPFSSRADVSELDNNVVVADRFVKLQLEPRDEPFTRTGNEDIDNARGSAYALNSVDVGLQKLDPDAVVQTGIGLPDWRWKDWRLEWSGPVGKGHEVRLWMLSPVQLQLVTLLRLVALLLLSLALLCLAQMRWTKPNPGEGHPGGWNRLNPLAGVCLASVLSVMTITSTAEAQDSAPAAPSDRLLGQLRERQLTHRDCAGPCVVASDAAMEFRDSDEGVVVHMRVHVSAVKDTGWLIPDVGDPLWVRQVSVDGVPTQQLRREPRGFIAVRLDEGVHVVEIVGNVGSRRTLALVFDASSRPRNVRVEGDWDLVGFEPSGDGPIRLSRRGDGGRPAAATEDEDPSTLPPWFEVRRQFDLALPWTVTTTVTRVSADTAEVVRLPALPGESVTDETSGARSDGEMTTAELQPGVTTMSWQSQLPISDKLELRAATDVPWTESWEVSCSPIWRCNFEGLIPAARARGGVHAPLFLPWPGESVVVVVSRPEALAGNSATIDEVVYDVTPSERRLSANLTMSVRSSEARWHRIVLPADAELRSFQIDGAEKNIALDGGKLDIPVVVGSQTVSIAWQQPWTRSTVESLPPVDLGGTAVNGHIKMRPGEGRWLLWTRGPPWGPAITFWSRLAILLVLSGIFAVLFRHLPLRPWGWGLLALGLTQVSYLAILVIVAWFVAMGWRATNPAATPWRHNLRQVGLVILTLLAAGALYEALAANLIGDLQLYIEGGGSSAQVLGWYADKIEGPLPEVSVVSLPTWCWRVLMMAWAIWLAVRMWRFVPWAWKAFTTDGAWRRREPESGSATVESAEPELDSDPQPASDVS